MHIVMTACPECGTVIAGNVLERHRVMECPRLGCEYVLHFNDLNESDQNHLVNHRERYRS